MNEAELVNRMVRKALDKIGVEEADKRKALCAITEDDIMRERDNRNRAQLREYRLFRLYASCFDRWQREKQSGWSLEGLSGYERAYDEAKAALTYFEQRKANDR